MKKNDLEILNDFKKYVDNYIATSDFEKEIKEQLQYVLLSGGKYIRPMFFFLLLEDKGMNSENYYNVGLAIEMVHTYSLIHDDLPAMDNDDMRRGLPSAHKKYGEANAILLGDLLLTHAFSKIIDNSILEKDTQVLFIKYLVNASGAMHGMISGQIKDIENEHYKEMKINDLKQIHREKTGAMISLPATLAFQILSDEFNDFEKKKIDELFSMIGEMYQIQDDYFDKYSNKNILGKTLNKDENIGKITYNTFYSKEELENLLQMKYKKIKISLDYLSFNLLKKYILKVLEREF